MLHDKSANVDREVDVLIEVVAGPYPLRIGVEANEGYRPMTLQALEGFLTKHRNIGINKSVVVSKNGFTKGARDFAKNEGILLLKFGEAQSAGWLRQYQQLADLSVYGRTYKLRKISFNSLLGDISKEFDWKSSVTVVQEGKVTPLVQFAGECFMNSGITKTAFKELKENEGSGGGDPFVLASFDLNQHYEFTDAQGNVCRPREMEVVFGYKSKYRNLDMRNISYGEEELAVGGVMEPGASDDHVHVAINDVDGRLIASVDVGGAFLPSAGIIDQKAATDD
ncbi:hypothetical protein FHY11_000331 [Xanthomonas arboricola]|uniref:hypothetical protein n=1 Tax=Xanthomonas euroxanthea TaxID=2259622 RepID=UPI00141B20EE|nr:hypothetical protein [Xanthomonas euroxanthea]NIK06865.1 hypothetical protein [Xanthomonas euroxanthea]